MLTRYQKWKHRPKNGNILPKMVTKWLYVSKNSDMLPNMVTK